ncbi:MAG: hypothetical protein OXT65_06290 [Alphaproteobacteria bacterium]|nr:hypothetical protein [Alphaproteobacteria bacterium]
MKSFKRIDKKFLMLATAAVVAFPVTVVTAATTNIDATANFRAAITLSGTAMDFDEIEYSAVPAAPADTVDLGTDASIAYNGVFSAGTGATPVAGDVTVTAGANGATLEVRCDATATMENASGNAIDVIAIEVAAENATGAFGTTNACNGIGGAAATTLVLNLGTLDSFKFGGQIDGDSQAGGTFGGAYSTATGGGDDIAVAVTYQ